MSKFNKIAKIPIKSDNPAGFISKLFSADDNLSDLLNKQNIKQNLQYLAALFPGWTDRYSPSAFYHALESDGNRGYGDTQHSQGNYEMLSPQLEKALEEFKKNPPKNLKDFVTDKPIEKFENINIPESSERYKAMREKLYPSAPSTSSPSAPSSDNSSTSTSETNTRFVKTSSRLEKSELKKIIPNWQITDVLNDMNKVSTRKDLSKAEKQQGMVNILSQYEKSIAPLNQYLKNNDIKYK